MPAKTLKILIAETKDFSQRVLAELSKHYDVTVKDITASELEKCLDEFDVFWFRLKFKLNHQLISKAKRCKFIVCPATGIDHIDHEACAAKGIQIISLRGESVFLQKVRATAEHTMGLAIALLRQIPAAVAATKQGEWNREAYKGHEIYEKKVGILGVGRLGKITGTYFSHMGAAVSGYDILPFDMPSIAVSPSMTNLFAHNDIISIHVNLNDATKHLVTKKELSLMKEGSFLINTSRGAIIKSEDLVWALEQGILAGAAVDVVENEFDHQNDCLISYAKENQNLIITPHIGGNTWESFEKTEKFVAEKLIQQTNSYHIH